VQHRRDNADELIDLWWPRPLQQLDPAQHIQQAFDLVERRRAAARQRQQTFDNLVRGMARRSVTAAPSSFTEGVRRSLHDASIAPVPAPAPPLARWQPYAAEVARTLRALQVRYPLTQRQRRAALGGASTMALMLVAGGLSMALAPSEVLALLGVASAVVFSAAAVGHLLSTAVNAIMGTTVALIALCLLYAALAVAWVRLVRQPVEA
jgi:hypothetical protein